MHSSPLHVVDERGRRYKLLRPALGRGGQGAVFGVEGGRLAAKLLLQRGAEQRERLRRQISFVRQLDLSELPIARPLATLREPHLGYVMELLTGMEPLSSLTQPPANKGLSAWYIETGGLRRRLTLLATLARALNVLHARALVYGDLSPNNVFISTGLGDQLRLIDTDNLRYESSPDAPGLYTRYYGAPELVKGLSGVTSLSDAWSLGTLVVQVLSLAHPLLGDVVLDGPPEDEDRALAGELPWIDDAEDASNRCSAGVPRELVMSSELMGLAHETFGAGRLSAKRRPGLRRWLEALDRAAETCLRCPDCTGAYPMKRPSCPWCGRPRPPFRVVTLHAWDPMGAKAAGRGALVRPGGKLKTFSNPVLEAHEPLVLTTEHTGMGGRTPVLELSSSGPRVVARRLGEQPVRLVPDRGGRELEVGPEPLPFTVSPNGEGWSLHFGPDDHSHRVARVRSFGGR